MRADSPAQHQPAWILALGRDGDPVRPARLQRQVGVGNAARRRGRRAVGDPQVPGLGVGEVPLDRHRVPRGVPVVDRALDLIEQERDDVRVP